MQSQMRLGAPDSERAADVKILLVDDEPKNLVALEAVLAAPDRTLVHAQSGAEALKHLLHQDFAVILLDVHMPELDGFETAELIRGREQSRDTPIIFLTAANRSETFVSRGYAVGAVDYILKPLDPDILRSKVNVFVELYRKTDQIQRQAAQLAETTAFLHSVLEGSTDHAITAQDLEGTYLAWNEGARRLFGYTASEVVGQMNARALYVPADVAAGAVDGLFARATQEDTASGVFERVRKDGSRFMSAVTVARRVSPQGEPVGFVTITQDISAQLQAEEERRQLIEEQAARSEAEAARDRLRQVIDVMPEGVLLADLNCRIYLYNAAALEVLGQAPADVAGGGAENARASDAGGEPRGIFVQNALAALQLDGTPCPPDALPLARSILRGEVVRGEQLVIPNSLTGREVPVLVNSAPLRDAAGRITGGVLVFQDITAMKDLEREKDAFLAAASHDLKNPLTAIKARAQVLQRRAQRVGGADGTALAEGLHGIDGAATRLAGMINELLDATRIQMGRPLDLDRRPMDLVALANQVVADFRPAADRHEIVVESSMPEVSGEWDRSRLERVLTNLLSNAVKYSPEGGRIRIRVALEDGAGRWAVLSVSDEGVGIPTSELDQVFERFYRASNVAGRIEGTGIGLSGARQIVEQHGGSIDVESTQAGADGEGGGSTFTIRLPVTAQQAEDQAAA